MSLLCRNCSTTTSVRVRVTLLPCANLNNSNLSMTDSVASELEPPQYANSRGRLFLVWLTCSETSQKRYFWPYILTRVNGEDLVSSLPTPSCSLHQAIRNASPPQHQLFTCLRSQASWTMRYNITVDWSKSDISPVLRGGGVGSRVSSTN